MAVWLLLVEYMFIMLNSNLLIFFADSLVYVATGKWLAGSLVRAFLLAAHMVRFAKPDGPRDFKFLPTYSAGPRLLNVLGRAIWSSLLHVLELCFSIRSCLLYRHTEDERRKMHRAATESEQ